MQKEPKPEQVEFTSCDAPPLDFSFKNIRTLEGTSLMNIRTEDNAAKTRIKKKHG